MRSGIVLPNLKVCAFFGCLREGIKKTRFVKKTGSIEVKPIGVCLEDALPDD